MNATRLLRLLCPTCLLLALTGLLTLPALAQSTWTGATSTDWNTASNWNPAAVPTASDDVVIPAVTSPANPPTLSSTGAVASTVDVQSGAKLTIASTGTLTINGSRNIADENTGFSNAGTVDNAGQITLGNTASVGQLGLVNYGTFNNQSGGQIAIDNSTAIGLIHLSGTFTNWGRITLGANASVGSEGLRNWATFDNKPGGQIAIDRSSTIGLFQTSGTFTNEGRLTIGANESVGNAGLSINNGETFVNKLGGQIAIDRSSNAGISSGFDALFTNEGSITIGAIASVGSSGLSTFGTFENKGCAALLNIVADAVITNLGGTITNSGTIRENASGTSSISSNTGLVQNLNGGDFTIGTDTGTLTTTAGAIWKGCTSTDWATATNWSTGAVPTATDDVIIPSGPTNQPTLSTSGALAKSVEVQSGATLTIASGGALTVKGYKFYEVSSDNFQGVRFYNFGTVINAGTVTLTTDGGLPSLGFWNKGNVTNQATGKLTTDGSFFSFENNGTATNAGEMVVNTISLMGFDNVSGGMFTNQAGGKIAINGSGRYGLVNGNPFTNEGTLTIGATLSEFGIYNGGTFTNSGCAALINITTNAAITNDGTFTNSGQIVENASGTSSISSNTGIVVNNNGGTFTVGSGPNQPLAVVSTNATQCSPPNGSIQLTGLKANQPYTLRYGLSGGTSSLLSPDSTATASGTLTIPALGGGTYALTLSGNCVSLPITLEATLTGPAPGFQGPPTVAGAPLCAGQALTVTVVGTCLGTLTAQLSDASGSFANPISLGAVAPGQNQAVIPPSTPFGTGYRLRVVSTSPNLTSEASAAFTVNALGQVSVALYPATPSRICLGDELPVTFSTTGACPFPLENVFTVQLSSSTGSFANPLTLGTANPGTTSFPLPLSLPAGTGYRVRVLTSSPATTSFASAPFELRYPSMANVTPGVGGVPQGGICRGNDVTVSFTLPAGSCAFLNGNGFIAQLSSASGSFNNPVSLGAVQAGVANSVTIPAGSAAGTGYRIRVLSSNPASTSLASLPFRVNACNARLSAEEPELVVAPNPVSTGGEIRVRVSGLDNPAFSLTTSTGRNVLISTKTDGTAEFVLTPRQALTPGLYAVTAEEGPTRITRRVLVVE